MMIENYILDNFKKKYGNETFKNITDIVKQEIKNEEYTVIVDDRYIQYLIEIAILEICNIPNRKIKLIISKMGNQYIPPIKVDEIQKIHKTSINLIKSILK